MLTFLGTDLLLIALFIGGTYATTRVLGYMIGAR